VKRETGPDATDRMRLLEVNPTRGWRGGESQTLLLCERLAERGHEVLLAAAPGDALHARASAAGIAVRGLRVRGDGDLFGAMALARIASAFRPDLIHLHTSRAHAAGWTASLVLPPTPLIVSRRVDFFPGRDPFTRLKYTNRVDRFLAVSDRVARHLLDAGVSADRIRTVYDGVPPRTAPGTARLAALRAELGIPAGAVVVGSVGALAPDKDPLTFVRAAALVLRKSPETRFLIVGDGSLRSKVADELSRLALRERTAFPGFRSDPIDCLALIDVVVVASRFEGLNSTVLDAMSLGRPIVATWAGGIPEIIRDGENGLLAEPGDERSLARVIDSLVRDRALAERLSDRARARAAELTDERMALETEAVYREVVAERAADGRPVAPAGASATRSRAHA